MDWQRYRLPIMAAVAAALIGLAIWVVTSETGDTPEEDVAEAPTLPEIEQEQITEIEIQRPEEDAIRMVKEGEDWRIAAPVETGASATTVSTAVEKLGDLEVVGRAATSAQHHERLEVDEAHGIHVVARGGGETLIDMWVGAFRAGNTMVRLDGQDEILMVRGSIKFAFNKPLRDWRDRTITDVTPGDVVAVRFSNENGQLSFRQSGEAWEQVIEGEQEPIEEFDGARVRTMISSLARLRAADFAEPGADPSSLGFGPEAPSVTLTVRESAEDEDAETDEGEEAEGEEAEGEAAEGAEAEGEEAAADEAAEVEAVEPAGPMQTVTIRVGNEAEESQRYVMVEGNDTIFVVSRFMADRLLPEAEDFTEGAEPPTPPPGGPGGMPGGMPGMPGGMPGMPGGGGGPGGGQIPPELMQQIQRQLQQQQQQGGGHP